VIASQSADVMLPVHHFVDGFNRNDIKMVEGACANETFIIDDFPPHQWHGSGAGAKWFHDLAGFGKNYGMSDPFVSLRQPRKINVSGNRAYAIVPIDLKYNENGHSVARTGVMTLVLRKGTAGWRIGALTWTWGVG
jgi:ketosteroid isomerase-like protein